MDSKVTLVNPDQQTIQLLFSRNSTLNAHLLLNGEIRYTVSTTDRHAQKTKIVDGFTKEELVTIQRRTFLPDKITFANRWGGEGRKLSDIMKSHKADDGYTVHTISTHLGDFYWKIHKVHRLVFYSVSDPTEPVAYRENVNTPINTFALVVRREYEEILEYIIPTFILLEQGMRAGEIRSHVAEGIAGYDRNLGTFVHIPSMLQ